ncbi:branched-chain amino acid aminotransferase [Lysinibacillus sphaericus]|uniref:branched-chain amino acid aminotransferase n=1 Tax=Lysinibacillus sphaericus TaxID=1421 RepID=UPI003F7AD86A
MLKKQMELLMNEQVDLALLDVEKAYAEKHGLLLNRTVQDLSYLHVNVIERCDKLSEELLAEESQSFLERAVQYLREHAKEFMYVASDRLAVIRVDSFALEFDEAFGVYSALFGLRLQKKQGELLHTYLTTHLQHENMTYSAAFSGQDGLWEINLALNALDEFSEQQSFEEVLVCLYRFIFGLLEELEETV